MIPGIGHDLIHVATALLVTVLLVGLSLLSRVALGTGDAAIIPAKRISLKGLMELTIEFIVNLTVMVVGENGKKLTPLFGTIFIFIFVNNVFGLVPGMTPSTDNLNTTLAIGIFSFLVYNYYGIKEHGLSYIKQFLGPLALLAPLMLIIELISHIVRPFSLALRLQGNMLGDHTVLSIFLDLVPYVVPTLFYCLGLFVCFMQAFVFTMLTMIYVSMAISHDH